MSNNVIPFNQESRNGSNTTGGGGGNMEARLAKLESDVEYIKRDIGDIKFVLNKIDSKLDENNLSYTKTIDKSVERIQDEMKELKSELKSEIKDSNNSLKESDKTISQDVKSFRRWSIGLFFTALTGSLAVLLFIYNITKNFWYANS